jgi:hypothetical protein
MGSLKNEPTSLVVPQGVIDCIRGDNVYGISYLIKMARGVLGFKYTVGGYYNIL